MDNCTSKTLFVREFNSVFLNHPFSKAKSILNSNDMALRIQQEEELKQIQRLEKSAHELKQIGVNNFSDSALKKSSQISKRVEAVKSQLIEIPIEYKKEIKLESNIAPTKRLITINHLEVISLKGKELFKIESLTISQGDRIVISGENGSGKSTLLNTINLAFQNRDLSVDTGIYITPSVKLGLMDQHLSNLPLDLSMKEYLASEFSLTNQQIINSLVNIGFSYELQNKKIKLLSYGQRSSLYLLALRLLEPNFYILDEPTNHLDISGQEQLESEIIKNNATCIIVSHDRAFASTLGTKFYEIYDFTLKEVNKPEDFSV